VVEPPSEQSIDVLTDWVEVSTLFGEDKAVSRTEASAAIRSTYGDDVADDVDEFHSSAGSAHTQDETLGPANEQPDRFRPLR
jgi:hypothetical protein